MQTVATVPDFVDLARTLWGAERRTCEQFYDTELPGILDMVDFPRASPELKVLLADTLIRESTPHCGAYSGNGDVSWFLHCVGQEMGYVKGPFDGRRVLVIREALTLVAHAHFGLLKRLQTAGLCGGPNLTLGMGVAALAATNLPLHLEYLFRVKGNYLDQEGLLQQPAPGALRTLPRLRRMRVGDRVNQIQLAFALYLHGNADPLALRLARLDQDIKVGDRLARIRMPAMHGTLADASAEAWFYGLLVSMFYYSER
jgi:hypothetical protein